MADAPNRTKLEVRLLKEFRQRYGVNWRDRLAHAIAGGVAARSLVALYQREGGHISPLLAPEEEADDVDARLTRQGDVLCALVVILGEGIVLSVPPDTSAHARLVIAGLEEQGIMQSGRTLNTGARPFRFKATASCLRRGASLTG